MATIVIQAGRGGSNGNVSQSPVWQGFPRAAVSATTSAASVAVGTITAERGECVKFHATGAVWVTDDGTAAAANNGAYIAAGETWIVQYPEGNDNGWAVVDA